MNVTILLGIVQIFILHHLTKLDWQTMFTSAKTAMDSFSLLVADECNS